MAVPSINAQVNQANRLNTADNFASRDFQAQIVAQNTQKSQVSTEANDVNNVKGSKSPGQRGVAITLPPRIAATQYFQFVVNPGPDASKFLTWMLDKFGPKNKLPGGALVSKVPDSGFWKFVNDNKKIPDFVSFEYIYYTSGKIKNDGNPNNDHQINVVFKGSHIVDITAQIAPDAKTVDQLKQGFRNVNLGWLADSQGGDGVLENILQARGLKKANPDRYRQFVAGAQFVVSLNDLDRLAAGETPALRAGPRFSPTARHDVGSDKKNQLLLSSVSARALIAGEQGDSSKIYLAVGSTVPGTDGRVRYWAGGEVASYEPTSDGSNVIQYGDKTANLPPVLQTLMETYVGLTPIDTTKPVDPKDANASFSDVAGSALGWDAVSREATLSKLPPQAREIAEAALKNSSFFTNAVETITSLIGIRAAHKFAGPAGAAAAVAQAMHKLYQHLDQTSLQAAVEEAKKVGFDPAIMVGSLLSSPGGENPIISSSIMQRVLQHAIETGQADPHKLHAQWSSALASPNTMDEGFTQREVAHGKIIMAAMLGRNDIAQKIGGDLGIPGAQSLDFTQYSPPALVAIDRFGSDSAAMMDKDAFRVAFGMKGWADPRKASGLIEKLMSTGPDKFSRERLNWFVEALGDSIKSGKPAAANGSAIDAILSKLPASGTVTLKMTAEEAKAMHETLATALGTPGGTAVPVPNVQSRVNVWSAEWKSDGTGTVTINAGALREALATDSSGTPVYTAYKEWLAAMNGNPSTAIASFAKAVITGERVVAPTRPGRGDSVVSDYGGQDTLNPALKYLYELDKAILAKTNPSAKLDTTTSVAVNGPDAIKAALAEIAQKDVRGYIRLLQDFAQSDGPDFGSRDLAYANRGRGDEIPGINLIIDAATWIAGRNSWAFLDLKDYRSGLNGR